MTEKSNNTPPPKSATEEIFNGAAKIAGEVFKRGTEAWIESRRKRDNEPPRTPVVLTDPNRCRICIFCNSGTSALPIYCDELPIAKLEGLTHFHVWVLPGKHVISSEQEEVVPLQCVVGQEYYIEITTSFWSGKGKPALVDVDRWRAVRGRLKELTAKKVFRNAHVGSL